MLGLAKIALSLLGATSVLAKGDRIEADVHQLRSLSLELPFIDEGFQMRNYDYGGDAIVNTMSHIRLTADQSSRMGYVWSTTTLPSDYWKLDFEIKVGGKGGYLYGDGMAMFVATERMSPGPVFGNRDYFTGLGLFFDTYPNGKHDFATPFVMGMVGDGKTAYDGAHDGDANRLGMCEAYFRNLKDATKVSVTYMKGEFVNVQLQLQPKDKWINCFTMTNVTLPEHAYLGFTALTGDISDNHDLLSVRAETMRPEALKNYNYMPNAPVTVTPPIGSSSLAFVLKLVVVVGACSGLFVGYKKYAAASAQRF
ncbi:hypothetical protein LPJ77_005524 [Coemansia sp. RSA 2523]|nr:hypothetical protein LPJ58_001159 [Coemansia sp. RSA 1591]KAJ1765213.1 hypothetical protein LPJ54_005381 [Coemansia sp. RSA 1824]KAJ1766477.1 hypothetical protein LPJ69_000859 [Coemansia sp. RSA 1752]KAJ1787719.1 hypothetical protein LPJ62_003230 [Coemansia sp. RSA 2167]KAJ1795053.1 hypothetical protein LPJ67_000294 [Coemansia sp. RSA 1938]KAJ1802864.1 hypothetical protein LPJ77_005524 [Coemansia sp. RSA 2523]KAJ2116724.1 hypothetical protein GGH17_006004 [Coemansia sp. RSA 788]KAJ2125267